eukprot:TRINITY_DN14707_c0_g1_i1.p1 TRINITY_DN14707_c0_g1~~TRINITY_DN14707_c0_g1_i1.p1  ORF type:complete len:983 (-),score=244.75 TRINITY_DN14707_c0_g1_i1:166-3114(-)
MSQIYMSLYAREVECQRINLEESTEFNRIWVVCCTYGLGFATMILAPYVLCGFGSKGSLAKVLDFDELERPATPAAKKEEKEPAQLTPDDEDVEVEPPDLKAAQQHLVDSSATKGGKWRGIFSTRMSDMSDVGGVGMELYFRLLFSLGYAFAFMSIVTAPILVFSWNGNFLPDTGSALAKSTVGNMGMVALGGLDQTRRLVIIGCQGIPLIDLTPYFGYLDVASVIIFMVFVCWFRFKLVPKFAKSAQDEALTVADFCLEVEGLPREIEGQLNYEDQLRKHFEIVLATVREAERRGGCCKRAKDDSHLPPASVQEVTLVRDWSRRLCDIKDRAKMMQQKKIAEFKKDEKTTERLTTRIAKKDEALGKKLKPEQELPVVRAFVTLNTPHDVKSVLMYYRFSNYFLLKLCNSCQHRDKRFKENLITVRRPPEPSNILVENADVPKKERMLRKGIMFILWLIAICLAGAIIFAVTGTAQKEQQKNASATAMGSPACDAGAAPASYVCPFQNATLWTNDQARNMTGDELGCFCTTKGLANVLQDTILREDICNEWVFENVKGIIIGVAASLIVVLLNVCFKSLILLFAEQEKNISLSALETSKMVKVFGSQFVNTALVILIINHYSAVWGFYLFGVVPVGRGKYADFERGWYVTVGGAMVTNLMTNSIIAGPVGLAPVIMAKVFRCLFKRTTKTQDELIELYTNPPFDISERFAKVLMMCFCTLMYSAGMPALNFFAFVFCFMSYWSDKIVLLKGSKRPPVYDTDMPKQASMMLLICAPLHVIVAILMYSQPCTFPSEKVTGALASYSSAVLESANSYGAETGGVLARFFESITLQTTWLLFMVLVLFVAILVLLFVLTVLGVGFFEWWRFVVSVCCPSLCGKSKKSGDAAFALKTWDDPFIQEHLSTTCPPLSYSFECNPAFAPLAKYLRMGSNVLTPKSGSGHLEAGSPSPAQPDVDPPESPPAPAAVPVAESPAAAAAESEAP